MKHVIGSLFFISSLWLIAGCTAPNAQVASLGRMVPAPVLKSDVTNVPLGEGNAQQSYLEFSGTCDNHIGSMRIWATKPTGTTSAYSIPPTTTYTKNGASVTSTNDVDCGDGKFDFFVSLDQVNNWFGGNDDVLSVQLVGSSPLGDSMPLSVNRAKKNTDLPILTVEKVFPANNAGEGNCDSLYVSLKKNNKMMLPTADLPFSLTAYYAGQNHNNVQFYESLSACTSATSVTTSTILSTATSVEIYYKFGKAISYNTDDNASAEISFTAYPTNATNINTQSYIVKVLGLLRYSDLDLGFEHTCAITMAGNLQCSGRNEYGQLSNSDDVRFADVMTPVNAGVKLAGVSKVSAGAYHTCAITKAGKAYCWGKNDSGQIGNGFSGTSLVPITQVSFANLFSSTATTVTDISAGANHTCTIVNSTLACWGSNANGKLGNSTSIDSALPSLVDLSALSLPTGTIPKKVIVGPSHSCALFSNAQLYCWGLNDKFQLGDGSTIAQNHPVLVSPLAGVTDVGLGVSHTCAAQSTGAVVCWGDNTYGQLGVGGTASSAGAVFKTVTSFSGAIASLAVGGDHSCALLDSGDLYCWGQNSSKQVLDDSASGTLTAYFSSPQRVAVNAKKVALGGVHSCLISSDNSMKCWGDLSYDRFSGNPYRWLSLSDIPAVIQAGKCYPINIDSHKYDSTLESGQAFKTDLVGLFAGQVDNNIQFYDRSSDCTSNGATLSQVIVNPTNYITFKYVGSVTDSKLISLRASVNNNYVLPAEVLTKVVPLTSSLSASPVPMDEFPVYVSSNTATPSTCLMVTIFSKNLETDQYINLKGASTNHGGSFYSDGSCSTTKIIQITIPAQQASKNIYFKGSANSLYDRDFIIIDGDVRSTYEPY